MYIHNNTVPICQSRRTGWSFGGLVAFEMAKVMSTSKDHEVVGLVMIDSINPQTNYEELESFRNDWNDAVASMGEELRPFVERSFNDTEKMARSWNTDLLPDGGKNVMNGSPPLYVLRAEEDERARGADWYHSQGWEVSSLARVQGVVDLPGRHFGIFKPENVCFQQIPVLIDQMLMRFLDCNNYQATGRGL